MHILKTLTPFKPTKLSGCALWLAADRGVTTVDGKVLAWADQSGNGKHATQSTSNNRPTYVSSAQGSKPTLRFTPTPPYYNHMNLDAPISGTSAFSIFGVFKISSVPGASSWPAILGISSTGSTYTDYAFCWASSNYTASKVRCSGGGSVGAIDGLSTINTNAFTISTNIYNKSNNSLWINGSQQGQTAYSSYDLPNSSWSLASADLTNSMYMSCDISEIIIFNRALTDAERVKVEQYLSGKFAITLS